MTTPILHYPARARVKRTSFDTSSRIERAALAAARLRADVPARTTSVRRTMRNGALIGAAIAGGIGLAAGSVVLGVSWLLTVEARAGDLLGAAEWAAGATASGLLAGAIAGGVVGAFLAAARRLGDSATRRREFACHPEARSDGRLMPEFRKAH